MASRPRPVPIKVAVDPNLVTLKLTGDMAGQEIVVRPSRMRIKHMRAIEQADQTNQLKASIALFEAMLVRWTMRDEETGELLPQPTEGGLDELTMRQVEAISKAFGDHMNAATEPPKA